jgi:hypothetical protein
MKDQKIEKEFQKSGKNERRMKRLEKKQEEKKKMMKTYRKGKFGKQ